LNNPRVEVKSFRKDLGAGDSIILKSRILDDGTIEGVRAKFYPGQEGCLQLRPCLWQTGRNVLVDLITYADGTNQYISGEDDYFDYQVTQACLKDDEIWILAKNTGDYTYTIVVDVVIDYFAGDARVVGGVK
jgi:hypothetical protein